ncbi:SDR family NAD(P)-dependent oxidoreductase [Paenibacillus sp. P96]|uniref:SDR family NAD(P)-dependent oxidoreductase n=1 Tax=Paenibacillus zeirhizosphaerae TaxID=2987519 RepID=A0ABT9FR89_9BACL|nr:SDR family NAD(P)-dependent oxidoreductase [Paenibacillus sp. P96]MDP4097232.1 SDR family NAD(P)-dependent oxidoreductase [Paenibacillus sp. P96]
MKHHHNKVALITGSNSGVGFELAKKMLSEGWQVIALNRSNFPADEVIQTAQKSNQLRIYKGDLADFSSLRRALEQIKKSEDHIDLLFNNAGVSFGEFQYSIQGRETHFEVNTVVPYIIFMELRELLLKGELKTVVNTSSNALLMVKQFDYNTLDKPVGFKKLLGPYAATKLALSLWTQQIAPAQLTEGIRIRSVCPGPSKTKMSKGVGMPGFMIPIVNLFFSHPSVGAARLYDAALGHHKGATGIFLNKGKATPFKFNDQSANVLDKVDRIYKQEFACANMQ